MLSGSYRREQYFTSLGHTQSISADLSHSQSLSEAAKVNFSDIPLEDGIEMVKQFTMHSAPSFAGEATYAGYQDVKNVAYIFCTEDQTLKPDFQKQMIGNINTGRGGKGECKVYDFESGHCPNTSQPEKIAKKVVEIIEKFE